jgi:hypothetical protein
VADAFVVDILLNACGETYETLEQFAETINLEGLLRTKQTRRDKDVADRIILERALETLRKRSTDRAAGRGQEP